MILRVATMAALALTLAGALQVAWGQVPPAAAPVVTQPAPRQSRFEKMAAKTGTLQKRTELPIVLAEGEGIVASVVRLEDIASREAVLALQIGLPEDRGVAVVSEEEMSDLNDSVQYILANMAALSESADYVRVEYRTLSGAAIGYMVHFATATGGQWAPTAYVHVPGNPFYPQSGGIERLTIQALRRTVVEAQEMMATMPKPKQQ